MSEQGDQILSIFTIVLAAVTAVLVWVTWRLGSITKQTGEATNALAVRPRFVLDSPSKSRNDTVEIYYFTVRNIGNGNPFDPKITATVAGKEVRIDIRPKLEFVSPENQ